MSIGVEPGLKEDVGRVADWIMGDKVCVSDDRPQGGMTSMKQLLTGVAMCAAVALSAPAWAQQYSPGGNPVGLPGPNPGGPGLTPYTTGPGQAPPYYGPPPAPMAPAATPPSSSYAPASPPSSSSRRYARGRTGTYSADNSANQLNRQELDRLQAQNYQNYRYPPPPSYAPPPYPPQPYPPMAYPPMAYPPMGTTGGGAPYRP
jgi:hypothetical protein